MKQLWNLIILFITLINLYIYSGLFNAKESDFSCKKIIIIVSEHLLHICHLVADRQILREISFGAFSFSFKIIEFKKGKNKFSI